MNAYKHTQRGTLIVVAMLLLSALMIVLGLTISRPLLVGVPILLLGGWLFHSLTIEIADGQLRWRFGPGWIRKQVRLEAIAGAKSVRTNFIEGWGIHLSRFGWLYNVSGWDAVAITLKDGKCFALGTDEPQALLASIRAAGCPVPA